MHRDVDAAAATTDKAMNIQTTKVTEVTVSDEEKNSSDIVVTVWGNLEGLDFAIHGPNLSRQAAGSMRFETAHRLIAALSAAMAE